MSSYQTGSFNAVFRISFGPLLSVAVVDLMFVERVKNNSFSQYCIAVFLYYIIVCMFICSWAERLNALPNKLET